MGIVLVILTGIIEIGLAVYSSITKSNQRRIRNWIRISAFIIFLVFVITFKWSFKWMLLAIVLSLFGVIAVISLLRRKEELRYRPLVNVLKAAGMFMLFSVALLPVIIFPNHKEVAATGKYEVATKSFTLTDEKRIETFNNSGENRKINIEFWYPQKLNGKNPLIVFSHGAFGIKESNTPPLKI